MFIERTDVDAETPILWPPHAKSWLIGKDPDTGKDWGQEEKGTTEDEMVGWHHWLDGHELEQSLGVGVGQRILACYSPLGRKELDTTERLNWLTNWSVFEAYFACWHNNIFQIQVTHSLESASLLLIRNGIWKIRSGCQVCPLLLGWLCFYIFSVAKVRNGFLSFLCINY